MNNYSNAEKIKDIARKSKPALAVEKKAPLTYRAKAVNPLKEEETV